MKKRHAPVFELSQGFDRLSDSPWFQGKRGHHVCRSHFGTRTPEVGSFASLSYAKSDIAASFIIASGHATSCRQCHWLKIVFSSDVAVDSGTKKEAIALIGKRAGAGGPTQKCDSYCLYRVTGCCQGRTLGPA